MQTLDFPIVCTLLSSAPETILTESDCLTFNLRTKAHCPGYFFQLSIGHLLLPTVLTVLFGVGLPLLTVNGAAPFKEPFVSFCHRCPKGILGKGRRCCDDNVGLTETRRKTRDERSQG